MIRRRVVVALVSLVASTAGAAPDDVAARFDRARADYVAGRCDQAEPVFAAIASRHPDHAVAVTAASLALDCLNQRRLGDELARRVDQLCAIRQLLRDAGFAEVCGKLRPALERVHAEKLAQAGRHEEAAAAYGAAAARRSRDPAHAELLYNAAVSYVRAGLRDEAAGRLRSLIAWDQARAAKGARPHRLAGNALRHLGEHALATAAYAEAAGLNERYALRWAGEREAPDALVTAATLRAALGDDARALEDLRIFMRLYGRRDGARTAPQRVAQVMLAMGSILERSEPAAKVAEHYRTYLRRWHWHGSLPQEAAARVKLAEALWHASCPVSGDDGFCISRGPARTSPCGARFHPIKLHARTPAFVREAHEQLGLVVGASAQWHRVVHESPAGAAAARARFLLAEAEHERFLGARWQAGRAPDAERRVVMERYGQVLGQRDGSWAVAALARLGQLDAAVAERMVGEARRKADCRATEAAAAPYRARSREALARCLALANELRLYDEWRAACARGLGEEAPPEIAPRPGFVASSPAAARAVLEERPGRR